MFFPKTSSWRAIKGLQLIHTDLGNLIKTLSLNDSKYYILFINEYSRFCWVYFMKMKSGALSVFTKFKALVENQVRLTVKKT